MNNNDGMKCPVWKKLTLSVKEAADYSGVGEAKVRLLMDNFPDIILRVGTHQRIKRTAFEKLVLELPDL